MNCRYRSQLFLSLLALSLSPAGLMAGEEAGAPQERDYGSAAVHRLLEWREAAGDRRAAGLYLMDAVPAGMTERVLVQDPAGRPIRITQSLDARRGIATCELLDDATGWWARLELDQGIRADSLGSYFAAAERIEATEGPPQVRLRLSFSDAPPVEMQQPLAEPIELHAALAEKLTKSEAGRELAARLPSGLAEAVLFLDASLSPSPLPVQTEGDNLAYAARGVVEVLAKVLRAVPPGSLDLARYGTPWPMSVGPFRRGTSSSDSAVLELLSRFRSIVSTEPLSDRPARETFDDRPPSGR